MIAIPGRDTSVPMDPVILELLTWPPALDALVRLGFPVGRATFTDGYVISKPPFSPPLFCERQPQPHSRAEQPAAAHRPAELLSANARRALRLVLLGAGGRLGPSPAPGFPDVLLALHLSGERLPAGDPLQPLRPQRAARRAG